MYITKLLAEGFSKEAAASTALMMTATIEGGIMLCLTQKVSGPLKIIAQELPKLLQKK
ncbi:LmrA/YxaF family transcription factor [Neobacillus sp. M.A.Huq-85]